VHASFPRLCVGYAEMLSSSRFVAFVFLLGEERSDCHHLMVVRWVLCAFNMHDLKFCRPRSLCSSFVYRYWLSFFPLPLCQSGVFILSRGAVVLRPEGVFPVTVQRRNGLLFAIAKLSVTPTVRGRCPTTVLFFVYDKFYHIDTSSFVFTLKIQSLPIKDIS
jgi:hypothetical protein